MDHVGHRCAPRAVFDVDRLTLVSMRSIEPGEAITFSHPGPEVELAQSFVCRCGHPDGIDVPPGEGRPCRRTLSYRELQRCVEDMACGLRARIERPDTVVACCRGPVQSCTSASSES